MKTFFNKSKYSILKLSMIFIFVLSTQRAYSMYTYNRDCNQEPQVVGELSPTDYVLYQDAKKWYQDNCSFPRQASDMPNSSIVLKATGNCADGVPCNGDGTMEGINLSNVVPAGLSSVQGAGQEIKFSGTSVFESCQKYISSDKPWGNNAVGSKSPNSGQTFWDGAWSELYGEFTTGAKALVQNNYFGEDASDTVVQRIRDGNIYQLKAYINRESNAENATVHYFDAATKQYLGTSPDEKAFLHGQMNPAISQFKDMYEKHMNEFLSRAGKLFDDSIKCEGLRLSADIVDYSDVDPSSDPDAKKKTLDGKISCQKAGPETQDYPACATLVNAYNAAKVGEVAVGEVQKISYMDSQMDAQTDMMKDPNSPTGALKAQEKMVKKQADMANQRAAFHTAKLGALLAAYSAMPTKSKLYEQCRAASDDRYELLIDRYREFAYRVLKYTQATFGAFVTAEYSSVATGQVNPFVMDRQLLAANNPANQTASGGARIKPNVTFIVTVPDNLKPLISSNLNPPPAVQETTDPDTNEPNTDLAGSTGVADANLPQGQQDNNDLQAWLNGPNSKGNFDSTQLAKTYEDEACTQGIYKGANLIMNSKARDAAKHAMIQAGIDVAGNLAKGHILNKQAKRIADAAKGIKEFDPGALPQFQTEDALVSACEANPGGEECLELERRRGIEYAGQNFNFNGTSRATTAGRSLTDDDSDGTASNDGNDSTNRANTIGKMGRSINGVKKGGGLAGRAPAASVKTAPPNFGGGGGGGGGGSASAPGTGRSGGGGAVGNNARRSVASVKFGGGGGVNFAGGRGGGARKKAKVANPFAKMFGKKKGGKSGVTSFRNPASIGKQRNSIFGMISSQYQKVNKKKLLLEYEVTGKN